MNGKTEYLPVTWERALHIWWACLWRTIVLAVLFGLTLSAVVGGVIMGWGAALPPEHMGTTIGKLAGLPALLIAIRLVLMKPYKGFSIRLVADVVEESPEARIQQ